MGVKILRVKNSRDVCYEPKQLSIYDDATSVNVDYQYKVFDN